MAFVYWIHLEEHTDVTTQGYVGITTMKDPNMRFLKHKSDARNPACSFVVHRAMNKYGDKIKFTILLECSKEDAIQTELNLRPEAHIGWNILRGGDKPREGWKWTDEQKKQLSESKKCCPPPIRKQESTDKHKETFKNRHPLDLHTINLTYWSHCIILYNLFLQGDSDFVATRRLGLTRGGVQAMWKRFRGGWNPKIDERMLEFIKDNPPTLVPNMTDVESNVKMKGVSKRTNGTYTAYMEFNGKRHSKDFNPNLYGDEVAFQKAVEYRKYLESLAKEYQKTSKYLQRIGAVGFLPRTPEVINKVLDVLGLEPLKEGVNLDDVLTSSVSRSGDGMSSGLNDGVGNNTGGDDNSSTNLDNTA